MSGVLGWLLRRRATTVPRQLGPGERVLAREAAAGDGVYVLTNYAFYWHETLLRDPVWQRIGWLDVRAVVWTAKERTVILLGLPAGAEESGITLPVRVRSTIAALAAERVNACVVACRQVAACPSCTATLIVQRDPESGRTTCTVQLGHGHDRDDPVVLATVRDEVRRVRAQLGC